LKFITLAFFLFSLNANCEYRVYQYYVHSKIKNLNPLTPTLVTSTLDPKSYIAYHGGNDSIEINLLRSWMCLGNTSHNSPCTISDGLELQESMKK
jgi:hypothetical protein